MPVEAKKVLYVRLPCWKIYPGGVIYVADFIHKQRPYVEQEILDLALITPARRRAELKRRLLRLKPDIVAFSWRNMQSFGPHPEDDALDVVMNFDHSGNLLRRVKAAWEAVSIVYDYSASRLRNFSYMRLARKLLPDSQLVVGGTAVSIFGESVAKQCPRESIVVVGEGEAAMLSIVDGSGILEGESYCKNSHGELVHHCRANDFDLAQLTAVDFSYVETIFPEFDQYLDGAIGVHTKRGCPYQCHFCLYNRIEGNRQRYRDPHEIASEIETLRHRYGVRKIWFTDAQFCSTRRSTQHVEQILDELIARKLDIRWTGYLRLNYLTETLASKMLQSGLESLDLSFTGTQELINSLTLGYSLEQQMEAFRMFKKAGYTNQKVKLYLPLNAPGETADTLYQTITRIRELYELFGRDNVLPFIFFIGIQPGTPIERLLIEQGYLKADYNPLTLNPFIIKRLLYNPMPLGRLIARAYLEAVETQSDNGDYVGRATMDIIERELQNRSPGSGVIPRIPFDTVN